MLGAYLTIDPVMKAMFDKIDRPDQAALFSVVVSGKDPMLDELDRYLGKARWSTGFAGLAKGDDPALREAL